MLDPVPGVSDTTAAPDPEVPIARHSVRRNLLHMMSSQLVTWTLATAAAVIIPRFLGPATLGELRLAGALWLIGGTVVGLGTGIYLQLEIARNRRDGLALVGPILVLRTVAFACSAVVLTIYVLATSSTVEFVVLFGIIGLGSLLGVWSEVFGTAFLGLEHMSTTAFAGAASKALNLVVVVIVLVAGGGVFGVAVVGTAVAAVGVVYYVWRYRGVAKVVFAGWRSQARPVLGGSVTFMAAGVALVLYQQIDLVVISWVAENEDLGWYGAADTLFGSLLFPVTGLLAAIFPTLGRLHATDPEGLRSLVTRTFSVLSLVAVPIGLGTTLVGPEFAPLLYGEDFRETGTVLAVLGPVIVFTFGTILFGGTALATDRGRIWVGVMLAAAALTVPLDIVLVPWANDRFDNGAIGGAVAYIVTESLQFVIGLVVIAPFLISWSTLWRSLRILAAGGVMFAVGWPLRHLPLPVPVVVCSVVYAISIIAIRVLGEEERRVVGELLARVGVRTRWAP